MYFKYRSHSYIHHAVTMWRAEFTQKLVYDLVERIYLTRERRYFLTNQEPLKIAKLLHKNGALFAQPSLHVTEGTPTGPRSMEVFDGHTNVKLLEFQGKRFDQSGSYYVSQILRHDVHFVL